MREKKRLPLRERHCWEIMQCQGTESCPARLQPDKACWEIARELDDYRSVCKICQDCLVFVLKNGKIFLPAKEERLPAQQAGCKRA
jgi:hypothetical protein